LKLLQVCPSLGTACGVANFAGNLASALGTFDFDVQTVTDLDDTDVDLVLIQHEFGLFDTRKLLQALAACHARKLLFAHTAGVEAFDRHVDGYLAMCPGMVPATKPVCVFPHPGWYSEERPARQELKQRFGYHTYAGVIGSSGFINPSRQFSQIIEFLLPWAQQHNWLINLLCSRHAKHTRYATYLAEERRLLKWAAHTPHVRLDLHLKSPAELELQFRACDLLWCWTNVPTAPYASGTCSDQYCSGTRIVVADKQQHRCLQGLPNVVMTPPRLEEFLQILMEQLQCGEFPQHDGRILSWQECARTPANFLCSQYRASR
jgi:hypothetical protein